MHQRKVANLEREKEQLQAEVAEARNKAENMAIKYI